MTFQLSGITMMLPSSFWASLAQAVSRNESFKITPHKLNSCLDGFLHKLLKTPQVFGV